MEFTIEKCAMLIMNKGKTETTERVELPNEESIRTFVKKGLQIPGNIRIQCHHANGDKSKRKEYLSGKRKYFQTKTCRRNLIKEINTCLFCKIIWILFKMDNWGHVWRFTRPYTKETTWSECIWGEKEEKNLLALKIMWIEQFRYSKNIQKKEVKRNW